MNHALLTALAVSLVLTLALEIGFFLLIGKRNQKDLLLLVFVNVITNPIVVLLYWLTVIYTDFHLVVVKSALEFFAVFVEGHYYKKYGQDFRHPYLFSIASNMFSFGFGVLLQWLI